MKKWITRGISLVVAILLLSYISACIWFYNNQESLVFMNPKKLDANFRYEFSEKFEEINIKTKDSVTLNSLLFKTEKQSAIGVIYNLHGAGGNISNKNIVAKMFTDENFDFYTFDYRGYGKTNGEYKNEKELYNDAMAGYNELLSRGYQEKDIVIIGVSFGSGIASYIAANNNPRQLILISPYYNLKDLAKNLTLPNLKYFKYLPTDFLLNYNLDNSSHIKNTKAPVTIFHGTDDRLIYYGSSLKLKESFKRTDQLITIEGGKHNGFMSRPDVINGIKQTLNEIN